MVPAGVTVIGFNVPNPPLHKYVLAPLDVNVVGVPEHIGFCEATTLTVGLGLISTVTLAVPVHPFTSVPETS